MKSFKSNIELDTRANTNFRKVLYTGTHLQQVLMSLNVGEDIGEETHHDTDQFFRFEEGKGKCVIDGHEYIVKDGDVVIVPAGARHNVINTDPVNPLKIYTLYAPPHHKDAIVRETKMLAVSNEAEFNGKTTE